MNLFTNRLLIKSCKMKSSAKNKEQHKERNKEQSKQQPYETLMKLMVKLRRNHHFCNTLCITQKINQGNHDFYSKS